jgi:hypothetical protein
LIQSFIIEEDINPKREGNWHEGMSLIKEKARTLDAKIHMHS